MFDMFKKKKEGKEDLSRRNFLKGAALIPAGVIVTASGLAQASNKPNNEPKEDYLIKTWKEEGITYMEYELPSHVQPFFKHPEGRCRAISVPIYNLEKEKTWKKKSYTDRMKTYVDMHKEKEPKEWVNPYIYIINIKGHDELFGAMINKSKLEFETNVYTVYG